MNTNKLKTFLFVMLIMTLQLFPSTTASNLSNNFPLELQEFSTANTAEHNLTLSIVFVNFDQELIDENYINNRLPARFEWLYYSPHGIFNFNFEFSYLDEAKVNALGNFMLENSAYGEGTGYELNTTLLNQELSSGVRSPEVFIPANGRAMDAFEVEEYINDYIYETPDEPGYTLYVLNFSSFDNGTWDHWYNVEYVSPETNQVVDWWYSGYRNLPQRQAIGWGGTYRFAYVDVSARSWYFDWIKTAWYNMDPISGYYHEYADIEQLFEAFDPQTPEGKEILQDYLIDFIRSYLGNVFAGPLSSTTPIGESISLQVLLFDNLTDNGYTKEQLEWVLSESFIYDILSKDIPWIDWRFNITKIKLSEDPAMFDYLQNHVKEDMNGKYIEVMEGLFWRLQNYLDDYFDLDVADIVLPCYAFLNDNIGFRYYGISFAGLGGMGWQIVVGSQNSLFQNGDPSKPLRGFSPTLIHELGHSLGFPHPHSGTYGWASDMIADVMSYFSPVEDFSTFYEDSLGRAHADYSIIKAKQEYEDLKSISTTSEYSTYIDKDMEDIRGLIMDSNAFYYDMDYNSSIIHARLARSKINETLEWLEDPITEEFNGKTTRTSFVTCIFQPIFLFVLLNVVKLFLKKKKH